MSQSSTQQLSRAQKLALIWRHRTGVVCLIEHAKPHVITTRCEVTTRVVALENLTELEIDRLVELATPLEDELAARLGRNYSAPPNAPELSPQEHFQVRAQVAAFAQQATPNGISFETEVLDCGVRYTLLVESDFNPTDVGVAKAWLEQNRKVFGAIRLEHEPRLD